MHFSIRIVEMFCFVVLLEINLNECQTVPCPGKDCAFNVPLYDRLDSPLEARLDVDAVNSQLKQYIDANIKNIVKETFLNDVTNMVNEKQAELKVGMLSNFSSNIDSTIEKYDQKFAGVMQDFQDRLQELIDNLNKEFNQLNSNIDEKWNNIAKWRQHITDILNVLMPPPVPSVTLCEDITNSGVYRINPDGSETSITVYCENGIDGGGWTVIQRRVNGSVDFYRGWDEYVSGFGNASGDFWLGLENIHRLTSNGLNELRLDFEDWSGVKKYSKYTTFSVDDLASDYTLSVSGHTGSATDAMQYHNGRKFSTKDSDNDSSSTNCAIKSSGGWWYKSCHRINLNGLYKRGTTGTKSGDYNVVSLQNWHGDRYSLKRVSMMIR